MKQRSTWWLWLLVPLTALSLRSGIAAVPPLASQIQADLGASAQVVGLLTALPLLTFAALSPVASFVIGTWGPVRTAVVVMLVISVASVARATAGTGILMIGTVALAVGVAFGNVLMPAVVKLKGERQAPGLLSIYAAGLSCGAGIAAAIAAPIASGTNWRFSLQVWALPAGVALICWLLVARNGGLNRRGRQVTVSAVGPRPALWRSPALVIALFFAGQSFCYYATTAWLPTIVSEAASADSVAAGYAMATFQWCGIVGTVVVPLAVRRWNSYRLLAWATLIGWAILFGGMLVAPAWWLAWSVTGGFAQGAGLTLSLTLIVVRSRTADVARRLSGLAHSVAYLCGSTGPIVVAWLAGSVGSWTLPLVFLSVVVLAQVVLIRPMVQGPPIS